MDNLSCVLVKPGQLEVRNVPISEPGENEVQIAVHSNGICASDVHKWESGKLGTYQIVEPLVLGHECSGIIVKLGKNVNNFQVGDRVVLEAGLGCQYCDYCSQGRYNLCRDFNALSLPGCEGSLANYINHPASYCFKLPSNVSLEEGALVEPLAIAVFAARRAKVTLGSRVLICGAGTIGNMCVLVARAMGATRIVVTDLDDVKLKLAERLGATFTVPAKGRSSGEIAADVSKYTDIDITLECSGANPCVDLAVKATKSGGTVCLIGILQDETVLSTLSITRRELDVVGSIAYANAYPPALDLLALGQVDMKPMITHRYALRDAEKAFLRFQSGEGNPLKIIVRSERCPGFEQEPETYLTWLKS